jgi:hypothetical protein
VYTAPGGAYSIKVPPMLEPGACRGESPLVTRTKQDGKWVEEPLDMVQAWSLFLHGDDVYMVCAGTAPQTATSRPATSTARATCGATIAPR